MGAVTGIYGGGVLMSTPSPSSNIENIDSSQCAPPVMFSLKKDPNSFALGVHQFPSAMPRFHTRAIESAGFQEVPKTKYEVSSIARSAIFPLPDVANDVFNIGLVTLQCSSRSALNEKLLDQLGYHTPPKMTYAVTMTCLGDMYCHSLLETNSTEEAQARQFPGLPVGTKAIPVPEVEEPVPNPGCMRLSLRNEFPVPSSAITPYTAKRQGDCCSVSSDIRDIPNRKSSPAIPMQSDEEEEVKSQDCNLAFASKAPHSMYELMKMNKATEESTLHLSNGDENVEIFRVAFQGTQNVTKEESFMLNSRDSRANTSQAPAVQHPLPMFGLELPWGALSTAAECISRPHISLPSSHTKVAMTRDEDNVTAASNWKDRPNEEIGLDFLKNLNRNYFNDTDGPAINVKSEWNSDSE